MKTKVAYSIILFIFSFSASLAQAQTIKLNLDEGYEYIYDLTEKEYVQKENGENGNTKVQKKQLKIVTVKVIPGIRIKVNVNITDNFKETNYGLWKERIDYIYGDFRNVGNLAGVYPQSFFSFSNLIFSIDLIERKIELLNRAELLENYYELLSNKNSEDIEKKIDVFNKIYLNRLENLIEYLVWFHNSQITTEGYIRNSNLEDRLVLKEKIAKQYNFSNDGQSEIQPARAYKYFSINVENGLLQNYKYIKKDSIKNKYGQNVGEYLYNVEEKSYRLLSNKKSNDDPVIVRGKIINSLSNKLNFRYLNEPFGLNLKKQTVYLNDSGYFQTQLDLKHPGFVFIENQNPNRNLPSASYVLYADKGDSIVLNSDLNFPEKPVEFSGTRISESNLLDKIKRKFNIFESGDYFDIRNRIYYDRRGFTRIVQDESKSVPKFLNDLYFEYESVDQQLSETENELTPLSYRYIKNEIKSLYYGLFFQYLTVASAYKKDDQILSQIPKSIQKELKINDLNSFYNDYGFYSRICVSKYVAYKYFSASQINNPGYAFRSFMIKDLNQQIQFSRMILTGSPFYREIAASLEQSFTQYIYLPWKYYTGQILNDAVEYLNLMTTNCYDAEIVEKIQRTLIQYKHLQNKNPEIKELVVRNVVNQNLKLKNVLNPKPTVVLFASVYYWWMPRLEKIYEENPEIDFIRIVQFNSQREWNDYYKLAEPKVPSFLYLNDSIPLEDIFLNSNVVAVFNKRGELINYSYDIEPAIKLAKQSLTEKMEFDKSQLQTIIIILSIILFTLILGILFWKWRVRQRFRKEEQLRRLRELKLTAIRSQMNPHFLFNCLNSVQNLVQQHKGREAHLYLSDFAGLIRKVLQNSEKEEVSLAEELEMTRQYLNLEKLRFDFEYTATVEDGIDTNNTMVPSMLLQPFAENAVVHGLQNKHGERKLKIEVFDETKRLAETASEDGAEKGIVISIEDNGIGRKAAAEISKQKNGKGSRLMKERLEILQKKQGEKYHLKTIDLQGDKTGTRVEILIPEEI